MALVKYGEMIAGLSGSINGTTHSRNKGGAYMRNRSVPTNPQTASQTTVRNRLGTLSSGWRALTQAQRDSWNSAVANFPSVNVFGDVRELTGLQLYIGINSNLDNVGVAAITTPPSPTGAEGISTVALTANSVGPVFSIAFTATPVPADHTMVVQATTCLSPGIDNANNKFRQIGTEIAAVASPATMNTEYTAKFGALVQNQKVFCRVYQIRTDTGEVSLKLQDSTIVL